MLADQNPPVVKGTDRNGIHLIDGRLVHVEGDKVVDSNGSASDLVHMGRSLQALRVPALLQHSDISAKDLEAVAECIFSLNAPCQLLFIQRQAVHQSAPISCTIRCSEMICHLP